MYPISSPPMARGGAHCITVLQPFELDLRLPVAPKSLNRHFSRLYIHFYSRTQIQRKPPIQFMSLRVLTSALSFSPAVYEARLAFISGPRCCTAVRSRW